MQRPQTPCAQMMPKRDQTLRSAAITFALAPGEAEFATLDSEPLPDHLTATNGAVRAHGPAGLSVPRSETSRVPSCGIACSCVCLFGPHCVSLTHSPPTAECGAAVTWFHAAPQDAEVRCLLRSAAFQLRDRLDNAVPAAGVAVRLVLAAVPGSAVAGKAPVLEAAAAGEAPQTETDDSGRVYWDEVRVVEGSGAPQGIARRPYVDCQHWRSSLGRLHWLRHATSKGPIMTP